MRTAGAAFTDGNLRDRLRIAARNAHLRADVQAGSDAVMQYLRSARQRFRF